MMNDSLFILDLAPVGGGLAIFGGVAFLLVMAAVAFAAFLLLRKTLKMAFRLVIVGVILAIAVFGCAALTWLGSQQSPRPPRPLPPRPSPTRSG